MEEGERAERRREGGDKWRGGRGGREEKEGGRGEKRGGRRREEGGERRREGGEERRKGEKRGGRGRREEGGGRREEVECLKKAKIIEECSDSFSQDTSQFKFPLELDMTPYSRGNYSTSETTARATEEKQLYELYSVVIHSGSTHSGHYTAYIKDVDALGCWTHPVSVYTLYGDVIMM